MHPCQKLKDIYEEFLYWRNEIVSLKNNPLRKTDNKEFHSQWEKLTDKVKKEDFVWQIRDVFRNNFGIEKSIRIRLDRIKKETGSELEFIVSGDNVEPLYWDNPKETQPDWLIKELCPFITHAKSPITNLVLKEKRISIRGLARLAEALKSPMSQVARLNLDSNALNDSDIDTIIGFLEHPGNKLREISRGNNFISAYSGGKLIRSLKNPDNRLISLDLTRNAINMDIVATLKDVLKDPTLKIEQLYLGANLLTDSTRRDLMSESAKLNPAINVYL